MSQNRAWPIPIVMPLRVRRCRAPRNTAQAIAARAGGLGKEPLTAGGIESTKQEHSSLVHHRCGVCSVDFQRKAAVCSGKFCCSLPTASGRRSKKLADCLPNNGRPQPPREFLL